MSSFNTGQITLPKARRSKFKTKHFIGIETPEGLLIKPVLQESDLVYYEDSEGFWLYSSSWINPEELISSIKSLTHGQD